MAESDKGKRVESSREMATTNTSVFPRDLLQSFIPASAEPDGDDGEDDDEDDEDKIELNLGLSLGGRFGIDKTGSRTSVGLKKLTRSSSVVGTMPIFREEKPAAAANMEKEAVETEEACPSTAPRSTGLTRTTSLPVETEEEWRKRKEMQTLRRMAAKRRRNEKLRSSKNMEDSGLGRGRASASSPGLPRWSAAANKGGFLRQHTADSRQGSAESQGGGSGGGGAGGSSSSLSEFESRPPQASSNCSEEARTLTSTAQGAATSNRLRRLSSVDMNTQGKGQNEMPCVFTKGDGPNGRRVDGILYRYGKGAEVRIMCVCHGTFLSPAEFVKHAGGGDVDHPLRHIVVNTASSSVM